VVASSVTKRASSTSHHHQQVLAPSQRASEAILDSGMGRGVTSFAVGSAIGTKGETPQSRVSSMFTFSEEDSQYLYSSSDERESVNTVNTEAAINSLSLSRSPINVPLDATCFTEYGRLNDANRITTDGYREPP
jgi:hypothetical protein